MNRRAFFAAIPGIGVLGARPASASAQTAAFDMGCPYCPVCRQALAIMKRPFEIAVNEPVPVKCCCGWEGTHVALRQEAR